MSLKSAKVQCVAEHEIRSVYQISIQSDKPICFVSWQPESKGELLLNWRSSQAARFGRTGSDSPRWHYSRVAHCLSFKQMSLFTEVLHRNNANALRASHMLSSVSILSRVAIAVQRLLSKCSTLDRSRFCPFVHSPFHGLRRDRSDLGLTSQVTAGPVSSFLDSICKRGVRLPESIHSRIWVESSWVHVAVLFS